MSMGHSIEVAIVGGGLAGAALATHLASAGVEVAIIERLPAPHWRACGVYSSPATRRRLGQLGLDPVTLEALIRPISEMVVETLDAARVRLRYGPPEHAVALDRVRLERALLDRAADAGAQVFEGHAVTSIQLAAGRPGTLEVARAGRVLDGAAGRAVDGVGRWQAGLVVGADGPRSLVARAADVGAWSGPVRRAGITVHRLDPETFPPHVAMPARMVLGDGWYCGVAPVPGGRVNIGIVVPPDRLRALGPAGSGPARTVADLVDRLPGPRRAWQDAPASDRIAVSFPLAHRVRRASGDGFLLVGDAAGFLDPLSGEGIHRALVSAELAAEAIARRGRGDHGAAGWYHDRMRARFRAKDAVSWLLQTFMARPALVRYVMERLAARARTRRTLALVLADLVPASRALEPRFLAGLLRP